MQLKRNISGSYAFLRMGILIVEPNPNLLAARSGLLSSADRYMFPGGDRLSANVRNEGAFKIAVLSQSIGEPTVSMLAQEIRLRYPSVSILILSAVDMTIQRHLYDLAISDESRPEELLGAIYQLSGAVTKNPVIYRDRLGKGHFELSQSSGNRRTEAVESDPSKAQIPFSASPSGRDVPSDENSHRFFGQQS